MIKKTVQKGDCVQQSLFFIEWKLCPPKYTGENRSAGEIYRVSGQMINGVDPAYKTGC